jgi:hypothetical protein
LFNAQVDVFANVFQSAIAQQRAGQQARFAQNLKAVANADDQSAIGGDRRKKIRRAK